MTSCWQESLETISCDELEKLQTARLRETVEQVSHSLFYAGMQNLECVSETDLINL
ncbi:MAG: hypothetical protein LBS42_11595 [Tannerella sp.]|jgi:phenylacetate-coenzyme A ligase PaaK-like adenylate-forming protein|nr:hypothetical protein [Tannerella sp.]